MSVLVGPFTTDAIHRDNIDEYRLPRGQRVRICTMHGLVWYINGLAQRVCSVHTDSLDPAIFTCSH